MGTLKKKTTTPSPAPATSILVPGRDFDLAKLTALTAQTTALADDYETVLEGITPDQTVPQRVMRTALAGPLLAQQAARFSALFNKFALDHRAGAGGFMHEAEEGFPLVVISFPTTGGSITPKWKEEAFRLGRELAEAKGETFDEKRFEEAIRARTAPGKINTGISLTEAG